MDDTPIMAIVFVAIIAWAVLLRVVELVCDICGCGGGGNGDGDEKDDGSLF